MSKPVARAISTSKIAEHRGRRRLWLEGRKLERGDIAPGDHFTISWNPTARQAILEFHDEGDRKVSRRERNGRVIPIVDINTSDLEEALGAGIDRAKVTVYSRKIVVEIHPDDRDAQERVARLAGKVARGEPIATGSLAHGGGILDHAVHEGMRDAGVRARLAFACEWDEIKLDTASTNNPIWDENTLQVESSMDDIEVKDLPEIDILIAGLPCVGASRAGKSKNKIRNAEEHDTAGHLFVTFLSIVKAKNPSIILLENVTEFSDEISATIIRKVLSTRGYAIHEAILDGNEFGALEMRRRWCLLATSPRLGICLDEVKPLRSKETKLSEILDEVSLDSDRWRDIVYMFDKAERDREKGSNFSPNFVDPDASSIRSMGAQYWKWRPTEPKIPHPTESGKARILSPREHARAKTIPYFLVDGVSNTLSHELLGNSVIHTAWQAVGRHMGERIKAYSLGEVVDVAPVVSAVEGVAGFDFDEEFFDDADAVPGMRGR